MNGTRIYHDDDQREGKAAEQVITSFFFLSNLSSNQAHYIFAME